MDTRKTLFSRLVIIAIVFGFLALGTTQLARAAGGVTGNLRGTVVDQRSNAPIQGALVTATSASGVYHATTDSHGFFALLQIPTDTYILTISKDGFRLAQVTGVTVLGDQAQSVGVIKLEPALKTLTSIHVLGRAASSAFQPNQTVDETTMTGARIEQALGEKGSTDLNKLVLAAPGVIRTVEGSNSPISIRGSASVEIGYQFDGVDFRGNFFDENPSTGFLNGIGAGHGALQVVSGAGDATQGGVGAGVVNIVPGRGTYPGDGFMSFDVGTPWYDHGFAFQYGWASIDNRVSDFFSVRSERYAPQIAPYGRDSSDWGSSNPSDTAIGFRGTSFTYDDNVLNNFFFRFGKNNNQELQVLTFWLDHRAWGDLGGVSQANFYPYDPYSYLQFNTDSNGAAMWGCLNSSVCLNNANSSQVFGQQLQFYQAIIPYLQNVPTSFTAISTPEEFIYGPNDFFKVGYTWHMNPTTSFNTFFYNWGGLVANNITGLSQFLTSGSNFPGYNNVGGRRVGFQTQITKQAGEKHILSFVAKFENGFPFWQQLNHGNTWVGLTSGRGQDQSNASTLGIPALTPVPTNEPRIEDWFLPVNVGQPVSAANPCVGPAIDNNFDPTKPTAMGCYIYSWLLANAKWTGKLPNIPATGFTYGSTDFQQYGIGLRDQWTPSDKLHIDYGVRLDGQYLKWGANQFNTDLSNPSDVGLGYAALGNNYLKPQLVEPRVSVDYVLNANNSLRASYGSSVSFFFAQTAGTPTGASNIDPILFQIPAKDSNAINTAVGQLGPACGSGWHGPGTNSNGSYTQNPYVPFSGSGVLGTAGWYFKCPNYAASIYWLFDQTFSAPDIGGSFPATYANYDLAWEHQFRNGWGMKITSYWRRGYDTYQVTLLNAGPPDPVTGQQTAGSFQVKETGVQKAFGLEYMITTPTRQEGWDGFLTINYVNELTNTPPVAGSDSLPVVAEYLYQTGTLFHQSYLPPLSAVSGIEYNHAGWRINPLFTVDGGEPFGVGQDAIGFVNGVLMHIPTGNVGVATPYAGPGLPNQPFNATCYVDPAFPGSYLNPHDFACRGYAEPHYAGQKFTRPRLYTDLDLEYTHGKATFGVLVVNLFNNYRGQPQINQDWQPVATGVGGLQSGQFANAFPVNLDGTPNAFYLGGGRDASRYDQYWLPFAEHYVPGISARFYVQFKL